MKTKIEKIILFIIIFIFVLTLLRTISLAGEHLDTDEYKTNLKYDDATYLFEKGSGVIAILRNIAAVVSVLAISIIGVRYMVGSVEQKAEYKQTMMPVVIGCVLIGGLSVVLTVIQSIF